MSPYEAPQTDPKSYPINGVDWRMLGLAAVSPFICVSILAFALGVVALIISVGRFFLIPARPISSPAVIIPYDPGADAN